MTVMDQPLTADPTYMDPALDELLWPRRLLHVSTMTSAEREGENTYRGVEAPDYNILPYTWGRYAIPNGPAININNVTWPIPAIDPARFTVAQFQNVINVVGKGVEFIWLDIACIDQIVDEIKMEEIGRQAGIFKNAAFAFVWLHGTPKQTLQSTCDQLFELASRLDGDTRVEGGLSEDLTQYWEPDDCDATVAAGFKKFVPKCLKEDVWLEDTKATLQTLTSNMWFSSLWTLQEAFLRPEAVLLSHEGAMAMRKGYCEVALVSILTALGDLDRAFSKILHGKAYAPSALSPSQIEVIRELDRLIQPVGLGAWENPNILYHSAKFRQASNPLDRIYGIMQVFGFRLGASAEPHKSFTLEELELQFAAKINATNPIWGQMMVHTEPAPLGKCWRVSPASHLPQALQFANISPASLCSIQVDVHGSASFSGHACPFRVLVALWPREHEKDEYSFWSVEGAVHLIALDATDLTRHHIPVEMHVENEQFEPNQALANKLLEVCGDELEMLLLGRLLVPDEMDDDEDMDEAEGMASVGLIVRRVEWGGQVVRQRVGVCVWAMEREREEGIWAAVTYPLG